MFSFGLDTDGVVLINLVFIHIQSRKFLIKMDVIFIPMIISTTNNKHIYYADMVSPVLFGCGQDRAVPSDTSKRDQLSKKVPCGQSLLE